MVSCKDLLKGFSMGTRWLLGLVLVLGGCSTERVTVQRWDPSTGNPVLGATYELLGKDAQVGLVEIDRPAILDDDGNVLVPRLNLKIEGYSTKDRSADVATAGFDVVGKLADKIPGLGE